MCQVKDHKRRNCCEDMASERKAHVRMAEFLGGWFSQFRVGWGALKIEGKKNNTFSCCFTLSPLFHNGSYRPRIAHR